MIKSNNEETRLEAARIIDAGGTIAFRTDTFYGLGVDPFNAAALQNIFALKGREAGKPILLLIADRGDVDRFIEKRTALFDEIARRHWPGPISLIGAARAELPQQLTGGTNSIGVRLPQDEAVRELLRQCGGALTATSANPSGKQPPRTAQEVQGYFTQGIDLIIDGGETSVTKPSTVLDLTGPGARLIREGAITRADLSILGI
jgi:L-threonylcarbamoyladenylate synthase